MDVGMDWMLAARFAKTPEEREAYLRIAVSEREAQESFDAMRRQIITALAMKIDREMTQ